jgi:hypothetical protein
MPMAPQMNAMRSFIAGPSNGLRGRKTCAGFGGLRRTVGLGRTPQDDQHSMAHSARAVARTVLARVSGSLSLAAVNAACSRPRFAFSAIVFSVAARRAPRSACHQLHALRRRGTSSPLCSGAVIVRPGGRTHFPSSVMANAFQRPALAASPLRRWRGPTTSDVPAAGPGRRKLSDIFGERDGRNWQKRGIWVSPFCR